MKTCIILCSLFIFQFVLAQSPSGNGVVRDKAYNRAIRQVEKFVDSLRIKQGIPGISICVAGTDKILWAAGFGYADLENKAPVTPASRFRVGSVSKSITSLALGKLYEEGKLNWDAPVQTYVSAFPEKQYPVTARQLAGHQAGIRHYREDDFLYYPKRYATVTEGLALFSPDSLLFRPGTAYGYSTYGYTLLSAVIEGCSGKDFLAYLREAVLQPLGMNSTIADSPDSIVPHRVRFYEHNQGRLVNAALVDNSYKWAGGGMLSTPTDLANMGRSLLNHTLLNPKTVELLFTPQRLADGKDTGYGIGWRIGADSKGRRIIHHGGTIDGGRTFLLLYPEEKLVLAITANMSGVNIDLPEVETLAGFFLSPPPAR